MPSALLDQRLNPAVTLSVAPVTVFRAVAIVLIGLAVHRADVPYVSLSESNPSLEAYLPWIAIDKSPESIANSFGVPPDALIFALH
jgi:hypothetical protein